MALMCESCLAKKVTGVKQALDVYQAAIKAGKKIYTLPRPARHGDVMRWMREHGIDERPNEEQGFVLRNSMFVDRLTAAHVAKDQGQIEKPKWPPNLYSEDLW